LSLAQLAPSMEGPAAADSIWVDHVPDAVFSVGALSPRSRRQDLRTLRDTMVKWAVEKPTWLS